jgi:hypothetical protein
VPHSSTTPAPSPATEVFTIKEVVVKPGEELEFDALQLASLRAGGQGTYLQDLPLPAQCQSGAAPSTNGAGLPTTCLVVTYQGSLWAANPAAGPGPSARWSTIEMGVVIDQKLSAAVSVWPKHDMKTLGIEFITDLCRAATTCPAPELPGVLSTLLRFAWVNSNMNNYGIPDFLGCQLFLSAFQAMHNRVLQEDDAAALRVVKHVAHRLYLQTLLTPLSSKYGPSAAPAPPAPSPPPTFSGSSTGSSAPSPIKAPAGPGAPPPPPGPPPPPPIKVAALSSAPPLAPTSATALSLRHLRDMLLALKPGSSILSPGSWDLEVDLRGQTLRSPDSTTEPFTLSIPQGARVRISNGTLQLPDECYVFVCTGAALHLKTIDITGRGPATGRHDQALLVVRGTGAHASLDDCSISVSDGECDASCRLHCMLVAAQASASLTRCHFLGAVAGGLVVKGASSSVTAAHCTAAHCKLGGFVSLEGGQFQIQESKASSNGAAGFAVEGSGAVMVVGAGCVSQDNTGHGFSCTHGGMMSVQGGCTAETNTSAGFFAAGLVTSLNIGKGSIAYGNKTNGFVAQGGACITLAGEAAATANGWNGFCSTGPGSRLEAGEGCSASHNKRDGFAAAEAGHMTVGPKAKATANASYGFVSSGHCSALGVSCGSVATHNKEHGFCAAGSGTLLAGQDCASYSNGGGGFAAWGTGSVLRAATGCSARDNAEAPFYEKYSGWVERE